MTDRTIPGACFCRAVQFAIAPPALFCAHCHCSMCRRSHGAGYVTWIGVPYERFEIVTGKDRLVRHRSSEHGTRSFCGGCGSSLFCESTMHPDYIDIVLANIDGDVGIAPQSHFFFSDRADWVRLGDDLPRFGGKTGIEPL